MRQSVTDRYQDWFERGRSSGQRWLLIVFDAREMDWEAQFSSATAPPAKQVHGTWHVEHVIDLHGSMEEQRVDLACMP